MNVASTRRNWPSGRGFERWYGFLGAETNQWYPDLVYDNHPVDQPTSPEEGYHLTEDLTDKALEFIKDAKAIAPDKPFFLYYAPGAAHAPHHAPEGVGRPATRAGSTWATRRCASRPWPGRSRWASSRPTPSCRRSTRSAPPETRTGPDGKPFPPLDVTRPWDSLSAEEKRLFGRMAEVYAGFLAHADHQIGRLLDYLEESGAAREHDGHPGLRQRRQRRGRPERLGQREQVRQRHPRRHRRRTCDARRARRPEDLQPLPQRLGDGVQHAVQDVEALRVQRRHRRPVHHLLAGGHRPASGELRAPVPPRRRHRADHPRRARRRAARTRSRATCRAVRRRQHALQLRRRRRAPTARKTQFYSMLGSRGIWHDGWKAVTTHPTLSGWSHFNDDTWELYHTDVDRAELHDLAAEHPEKLRELVNLWYAEAGANGAFPLDDRSALEIILTPRPLLASPREPLRLLPRHRRGARVAGGEHPQPLVRDRRAGRHPRPRRARACCSRTGSRFGGHALYVKDNRLHYVYNFVGIGEQKVVADRGPADRREPDPVGRRSTRTARTRRRVDRHPVALPRRREGRRGPDQDPAGQVLARRRGPVRRAATAASRSPPTTRATAPWAFTGGTIHRVAVDVSGEPYVDLEREAEAMLMRE